MNPPDIEHAAWCDEPDLRSSVDMFDQTRTRWRCPSCSRSVTVREVAS